MAVSFGAFGESKEPRGLALGQRGSQRGARDFFAYFIFNDDEISFADESGLFRPYAVGNKTAVSLGLVIIRALVTEQITGLQFASEMKEIAHAGQPASIILVPLELKGARTFDWTRACEGRMPPSKCEAPDSFGAFCCGASVIWIGRGGAPVSLLEKFAFAIIASTNIASKHHRISSHKCYAG